ncbi:hypothetical protein BTO18_09550 [Polaribacter porphyrae]|uniref:Replication-associated protein G2P N-terminal domain-containing protein n=2 Tax=Polaribacter porphyrae TaxID=1137780 RepID=A0A2S7WQ46_9FLAO|nr:hypothetical protein BTO18_09550 [Polaribacter porphyrae]
MKIAAVNKSSLKDVDIITHTCLPFSSHFEIDSIRLFIHWSQLIKYDYEFLIALIKAEECSIGYRAKYKGFNILISKKGITITGSISNYFVGHTNTLPYSELRNAIEKLGAELSIDLHEARLFRLDINNNIITDQYINAYTHHLFTHLSRFKRLEQVDGVKFKTNSKELVFYNKSKEIYEKRGVVADNWFRIEFRIIKDVKKYTGLEKMKDLYKIENYHRLLNLFYSHYIKVKKQTVSNTDFKQYKSKKEYANHLMLKGVEAKGGDKDVRREIEQMDSQGMFTNRNHKYRLNRMLDDLLNTNSLTIIHPLAVELNRKFEKFYTSELKNNLN